VLARDAASARRGMSVTLSLTLPVPSPRSFKRAVDSAPAGQRLSLGKLLRLAFREATKREGRARATWRDDFMTGFFAFLMVFGLFLDGWNHINLQDGRLGPFLTPWHGILYAGFTATAAWILTRQQQKARWSLTSVPAGYGMALVGMGIATVGLGGDAVWHTTFGVETGITRLISPFHIVLFTGASLLVTSAFRAAWTSDQPARVRTFKAFLPALLSLTLLTSMITFIFQDISPFVTWVSPALFHASAASPFKETVDIYGVMQVLITNVIFIAPVLVMLRRWRPPFGAVTFMFGLAAGLNVALTNAARGGLVGAAILGGLAADITIAATRPSPDRRWAHRMVGLVTPAVMWGTHFAVMRLAYGVTWAPELSFGSLLIASLTGLLVSFMTTPTPVPGRAWIEGDLPVTESAKAAFDARTAAGQDRSHPALTSSHGRPVAARTSKVHPALLGATWSVEDAPPAPEWQPARPRRQRPLVATPNNGSSDGHHDHSSNGSSNGHANGYANGTANGTAIRRRAVAERPLRAVPRRRSWHVPDDGGPDLLSL